MTNMKVIGQVGCVYKVGVRVTGAELYVARCLQRHCLFATGHALVHLHVDPAITGNLCEGHIGE